MTTVVVGMGGTRQSNLIRSLPYFSSCYIDLAFTAHAEHSNLFSCSYRSAYPASGFGNWSDVDFLFEQALLTIVPFVPFVVCLQSNRSGPGHEYCSPICTLHSFRMLLVASIVNAVAVSFGTMTGTRCSPLPAMYISLFSEKSCCSTAIRLSTWLLLIQTPFSAPRQSESCKRAGSLPLCPLNNVRRH